MPRSGWILLRHPHPLPAQDSPLPCLDQNTSVSNDHNLRTRQDMFTHIYNTHKPPAHTQHQLIHMHPLHSHTVEVCTDDQHLSSLPLSLSSCMFELLLSTLSSISSQKCFRSCSEVNIPFFLNSCSIDTIYHSEAINSVTYQRVLGGQQHAVSIQMHA